MPTGQHSLIILTRDDAFQKRLISMIDYKALGIYLLPCVRTREDLISSVQLMHPHILLLEASLLSADIIRAIQTATIGQFVCKIIVLYEPKDDLRVIQNHLSTSAAVPKDVTAERLHRHLKRAVDRLNWNSQHTNFSYEATRYYFNTVFLQTISASQSIETVNEAMGYTFQDGLFRVIIVKLDYNGDPREAYGQFFPLQKRIEELFYATFIPYCHEIVLCSTFDGLIATMNWPEDKDRDIFRITNEAHLEIKKICQEEGNFTMTFCLGKIYRSIDGIIRSRADAHHAMWSRLIIGRDRMICHLDNKDLRFPLSMEEKMKTLRIRFLNAFDALDIDAFRKCVDEVFQLPEYVLGSDEVCVWLRHLVNELFEQQKNAINHFTGMELLKNKTIYLLMMAPTLQKYRETLVEEFTWLIRQIKEDQNKDFSPYIQSAIAYINAHYAEKMTLSSLADFVGISTSYLSNRFKAETGVGISNYITYTRIQQACRMLRETSEPVVNIADTVRIEDPTYFTKMFKKFVGMTPSEYRRIFG